MAAGIWGRFWRADYWVLNDPEPPVATVSFTVTKVPKLGQFIALPEIVSDRPILSAIRELVRRRDSPRQRY